MCVNIAQCYFELNFTSTLIGILIDEIMLLVYRNSCHNRHHCLHTEAAG